MLSSQPDTRTTFLLTSAYIVGLGAIPVYQGNAVILAFSSVLMILALTALYRIYQNQIALRHRTQRYQQLGRKLVHLKRSKRRDEQLALKILDHIVHQSPCNPQHAAIWQRPLQHFSGDLAMNCQSSYGDSYTLLADMTGHGIAAAIGATPVASIFQATARRGMAVEEIVCELNNKLTKLLPSGFFCCAAIVKSAGSRITVCNAGLPDMLVAANDGSITDRITSTQLPLGIQKLEHEDVQLYTKFYKHSHRLYAFTDGLIETPDKNNDKYFDVLHLESAIASQPNGVGRLSVIQQHFEAFAKGTQMNDDISIVEVKIC